MYLLRTALVLLAALAFQPHAIAASDLSQVDCKGADLSDRTDPVCGRGEASISNAAAYAFIKSMSRSDRIEAEQFYMFTAIRCFSRAIWSDYGGITGSQATFLDISNKQCSTDFGRYIRLCTFNNTGRLVSDLPAFRNEMQICWDVFFRAAWEDASGIGVSADALRIWYPDQMRKAGRPRL